MALRSRRDRGPHRLVKRQLGLPPGGGHGFEPFEFVTRGLGRKTPTDHGVDGVTGSFGETGRLPLGVKRPGHGPKGSPVSNPRHILRVCEGTRPAAGRIGQDGRSRRSSVRFGGDAPDLRYKEIENRCMYLDTPRHAVALGQGTGKFGSHGRVLTGDDVGPPGVVGVEPSQRCE